MGLGITGSKPAMGVGSQSQPVVVHARRNCGHKRRRRRVRSLEDQCKVRENLQMGQSSHGNAHSLAEPHLERRFACHCCSSEARTGVACTPKAAAERSKQHALKGICAPCLRLPPAQRGRCSATLAAEQGQTRAGTPNVDARSDC